MDVDAREPNTYSALLQYQETLKHLDVWLAEKKITKQERDARESAAWTVYEQECERAAVPASRPSPVLLADTLPRVAEGKPLAAVIKEAVNEVKTWPSWSTSSSPSKYHEIASDLADTLVDKQAAYGDSFGRSGRVLEELYPDGIKPAQYGDLLAIVRVLDKLFRIATRKDAFGESPWSDLAGYGILAVARDRTRTGPVPGGDSAKNA